MVLANETLLVSDVHFDPFYDPTLFPALVAADVSQWDDIFKTSSITTPSTWGSDTKITLCLFNHYYAFWSAYLLPGLLDNSLTQLFPELVTNNAKQTFYRSAYTSGYNALNPITHTNWPVYWCGIGEMGQQELMDCVNTY